MEQKAQYGTDRNEDLKTLMALARKFANKHGCIGVMDEDDIAQNALIKAIKRFPNSAINVGWLLKVVDSVAGDAWRKYGREARHLATLTNEEFAGAVCELADQHRYVAVQRTYVSQREKQEPDLLPYLQQILTEIPEEQRKVLELYAQDYSYEEIATITKANVGTVRSRLYHARQQAKKLIEPSIL
jgi:RNA polymerase sigma factor (sigma-70 family)